MGGTYKARSNIGKLTLGSGYNSSWYIWSWGVSDSGLEQVIAERQKILLSSSRAGVRRHRGEEEEEEEEEEVEEQRRGEEGLTQKMLHRIALYNNGCRHFTVKLSWSSEEEETTVQKVLQKLHKNVGGVRWPSNFSLFNFNHTIF